MIKRKVMLVLILLGIVVISLVLLNNSVSAQCFGFLKEGVCYNIGDELRIDGEYFYVDSYGDLKEQKISGSSCNNDFECLDNLCSNGECVDLYKEVEDNTDLIENIEEQEININQGYDLKISIATTRTKYPVNEVIKLK